MTEPSAVYRPLGRMKKTLRLVLWQAAQAVATVVMLIMELTAGGAVFRPKGALQEGEEEGEGTEGCQLQGALMVSLDLVTLTVLHCLSHRLHTTMQRP